MGMRRGCHPQTIKRERGSGRQRRGAASSNYERYRNLTAKYTAFLAATQMHESQRELELLSAIDADRDVVLKEALREASDQSRNRIEETASQCSLRSSSRASFVSQRSNSMSIAAAQARAQADASRARAAFSRREAAMRLEKAKIEAELEILQQEREVAAAEAQANALEAAAEQDGGEGSRLTPPVDPTLRTVSFVAEKEDLNRAFQSPQHPVRSVIRHQNDYVPLSEAATGHGTPTGIHAGQARPTHDTMSDVSSSQLSGVLKFLCRRDLVSGGLTKFDDHPENYRAWKSSSKGVTRSRSLPSRRARSAHQMAWPKVFDTGATAQICARRRFLDGVEHRVEEARRHIRLPRGSGGFAAQTARRFPECALPGYFETSGAQRPSPRT